MRSIILLALLAVWLALPLTTEAHADFSLLVEVIGEHETQGVAAPDSARGQSDEIGRYQIRPGTARQMGFRGDLKMLETRSVSRYFALKYLRYCSGRLRTDNPAKLAHCYNGGPNLPWEGIGPARRYAAAVMVRYRAAQRAQIAQTTLPWRDLLL